MLKLKSREPPCDNIQIFVVKDTHIPFLLDSLIIQIKDQLKRNIRPPITCSTYCLQLSFSEFNTQDCYLPHSYCIYPTPSTNEALFQAFEGDADMNKRQFPSLTRSVTTIDHLLYTRYHDKLWGTVIGNNRRGPSPHGSEGRQKLRVVFSTVYHTAHSRYPINIC